MRRDTKPRPKPQTPFPPFVGRPQTFPFVAETKLSIRHPDGRGIREFGYPEGLSLSCPDIGGQGRHALEGGAGQVTALPPPSPGRPAHAQPLSP